MAIHLPICAFQKFKEHLSKLETFHVCNTRENLLNMRVHDENDYLIILKAKGSNFADFKHLVNIIILLTSILKIYILTRNHFIIDNFVVKQKIEMSIRRI